MDSMFIDLEQELNQAKKEIDEIYIQREYILDILVGMISFIAVINLFAHNVLKNLIYVRMRGIDG